MENIMNTTLDKILKEKIEFNNLEAWNDFATGLNINLEIDDNYIEKIIVEACEREDFTRSQIRNFLASDLTTDNIEKISVYKDRLSIHFKDVEFVESEYAENNIDYLKLVYYFNNKQWFFILI
jgi:hypothetical protein